MPDYNSAHTGPEIDEAISRALPGGGIDQEMAQKEPAIESTDYPGCYYRMVDGAQEWINPPMAVGVEYRTTERYLGKPVYVKAVSVGAMPAASGASNRIMVGFNPSNLEKIVRWEGTVTDGTMVCTLPVHASNGMVVGLYGYWYSGIIYIESNGDYSGYSGTLTFWYTKTTD